MAEPRLDLGIDAASDDASLALVTPDGREVATRVWRATTTISRELLGHVEALLAEAGVAREEIGRIAVNVGPGQYGAVRSAIATAQGMALALDVPLAGVGRLEADAARVGSEGGPTIVAVHNAGRGVAWAAYERDPAGAPREVLAPSITSPEEAARLAPRPALWTGESSEALERARDAEARTGDTVAADPAEPRAVALLRIARARMAFGDPGLVDALYLRPPSITRPTTTPDNDK